MAAAAFFGPAVAYAVARLLAPALTALSPVGGFLASANLGAATRRFSSASTPLVLTVALSCTFLFSSTTIDHATTQQLMARLTGQLAVTSAWPGLPAEALADARATRGVRSAVALTSTTPGPSLGSGDALSAQILTGGQGGGLDAGVTSGSLSALHGDAIALGRHVAGAVHARIGERVAVMLGDGTPARATVVAIYSRDLAFGDALLSPGLAAAHQTTPLLNEILIEAGQPPTAAATRLQALDQRYPGLHVSDSASLVTANDASNELNHWLGPFFVAMIFAFTSIAVLNTLIMIALRCRRELALLRLVGASTRQVRSMARWEAVLIIAIAIGTGLAIAATALLPLSRAFTGVSVPLRHRLARGDPRRLGGAGPGGPVGTDVACAAHAAGRGDRDPGVGQVPGAGRAGGSRGHLRPPALTRFAPHAALTAAASARALRCAELPHVLRVRSFRAA